MAPARRISIGAAVASMSVEGAPPGETPGITPPSPLARASGSASALLSEGSPVRLALVAVRGWPNARTKSAAGLGPGTRTPSLPFRVIRGLKPGLGR